MLELIIWLWALLCPNPNHTPDNHGNCNLVHVTPASIDGDDTGDETGNFPPKPPVPPPPPPGR